VRNILFGFAILLSAPVFGADKGSGGGGSAPTGKLPMAWFGLGGGKMNINSPKDDITPSGYLNFEIGGQTFLFKNFSRLQFTLAAFAGLSSGKMSYRYLSESPAINYSADEVRYQMSNIGVRTGVQLRLIDAGWYRLFAEGGVFGDSSTTNYTTIETTLATQGSTYIKGEKDLTGGGWYADAGMDVRIIRYGIRLGARQFNGTTGRLKALNNQRIRHRTEFGYVSFFKDF
jgi:hypothetical protein